MAENTAVTEPEVTEQEGATPEATSNTGGDQSRYVTADEFWDGLQQLASVLKEENSKAHQGLQGLLDAKVSEIAKATGVDRETAVAIKAAAQKLLGDDQFEAMSTKAKLDALEAETARQQQQQPPQDKKQPEPDAGDAPTLADVINTAYQTDKGPEAKRRVERAGLTWAEMRPVVEAIKPPVRNGRVDWTSWNDKVDEAIASEADKKHQAEKAPVRTIDLKPAGSNGSLLTGKDALRNWFARPENQLVK